MVTINSANAALKTMYLDVVANQLNTNMHPFLTELEKTSQDVVGKLVKRLVPYGVNGGIGAGTESGALPRAFENKYLLFEPLFLPLTSFRYLTTYSKAKSPIGTFLCFDPLPKVVTTPFTKLTFFFSRFSSSLTRRPVAYISSSIARSRIPLSVSIFGDSNKASTSSIDKHTGSLEGFLGGSISGISPSKYPSFFKKRKYCY